MALVEYGVLPVSRQLDMENFGREDFLLVQPILGL